MSSFYPPYVHIPKVQKDTDDLTVIFALLGSECVKAVRRMLLKLTPNNKIGFKIKLTDRHRPYLIKKCCGIIKPFPNTG